MLVMRRVYSGLDGSEIFALDQSRSAATTLSGLAFIQEWTTSPWSLLMHNDESLMRTCSRLPVGSGMHVDPSSSDIADMASPVDRRRHLEALAGGLKSIYMLHAGEDLVVQFASWISGAFEGMEAELREFAGEHVLRSGRSNASVTHLAHQASVSRELPGLRHFTTSPLGQYGTDDRWPADSASTDSSTPSLGLLSYAASIVDAMTMSRGVQQSRDAAIAVGLCGADQLSWTGDRLSRTVPGPSMQGDAALLAT
jgi:hypothetical protein